MAFNPSPKVRAAADVAKEFGKDQVVILMLDETAGTVEYASYGKDKKRCASAKDWAEHLFHETMTNPPI